MAVVVQILTSFLVLPIFFGGIALTAHYFLSGTPAWPYLINDEPATAGALLRENVTLYLVVYCTAHFLVYVRPQRKLFAPLPVKFL